MSVKQKIFFNPRNNRQLLGLDLINTCPIQHQPRR